MDAPSLAEVRSRSALLTQRFPSGQEGDESLGYLIQDATALVASLTCRAVGGSTGEEVPEDLEPLAIRCVVEKAEQLVLRGRGWTAQSRIGAGAGELRSFTAGRYSESYFGPGEASDARKLDSDPVLHEYLWALATEQCRENWMAMWSEDQFVPAAGPQAFDWGARPGGYYG